MKTLLNIKNLEVSYNGRKVLKGINLDINVGERVYLLGGNGAGKSTLIKAILGLVKIDDGEILLGKEKLNQAIIASHFGYVPQYTELDRSFPISVEEIIKLECGFSNSCPSGVSGHLKEFDAEFLLGRKLSDLSGGEFQKVLIARALVTDPDILLLDEPTNNLDQEALVNLSTLIDNFQNEGKTVVIVTHDHEVINQTSTSGKVKVVHMEDGQIKSVKMNK